MADIADRASEITQQSLDAALSRKASIAHIASNPDCPDCGEAIPAARRNAAPWATRCIECQSIYEGKARHVR